VFYEDPETGRFLVRFAFCKKLEVNDEAVRRLLSLRRRALMLIGKQVPAGDPSCAGLLAGS
jgi:hypothetical protein